MSSLHQLEAIIAKKYTKASDVRAAIDAVKDNAGFASVKDKLVEIRNDTAAKRMNDALKRLITNFSASEMDEESSSFNTASEFESSNGDSKKPSPAVKSAEEIAAKKEFNRAIETAIADDKKQEVEIQQKEAEKAAREAAKFREDGYGKKLSELLIHTAKCVDYNKHPHFRGYKSSEIENYRRSNRLHCLDEENIVEDNIFFYPYGFEKRFQIVGVNETNGKDMYRMLLPTDELRDLNVTGAAGFTNMMPLLLFGDYDTKGDKENRKAQVADLYSKIPDDGSVEFYSITGFRFIVLVSYELLQKWRKAFNSNKVEFELENGAALELAVGAYPKSVTTMILPDSFAKSTKLGEEVVKKYKWTNNSSMDTVMTLYAEDYLKCIGCYDAVMHKIDMQIEKNERRAKRLEEMEDEDEGFADVGLSKALIAGIQYLNINFKEHNKDKQQYGLHAILSYITALDSGTRQDAIKAVLDRVRRTEHTHKIEEFESYIERVNIVPEAWRWRCLKNAIQNANPKYYEQNIEPLLPTAAEKAVREDDDITIDIQMKLLEGLKGIELDENEYIEEQFDKKKKSLSLVQLLQAVNALDTTLVEEGREIVKELWLQYRRKEQKTIKSKDANDMAKKAAELAKEEQEKGSVIFDAVLSEIGSKRSYIPILIGIVSKYNSEFFSENISPLVKKAQMRVIKTINPSRDIDLKDKRMTYEEIIRRCHIPFFYNTRVKLAKDMAHVFCRIRDVARNSYAMKKPYDAIPGSFQMITMSQTAFKEELELIYIKIYSRESGALVKYTGWEVFVEFADRFFVNSNDEIFNWFHGFYYDPHSIPFEEAEKNADLQWILSLAKDDMMRGNSELYEFWLNCWTWKMNTLGRWKHMEIFYSDNDHKQCGKTIIHNMFCELFRSYNVSLDNLAQLNDPVYKAKLENALIVNIEELDDGKANTTRGYVKAFLSGQTRVNGKRLYNDPHDFTVRADIVGNTNNKSCTYTNDDEDARLFVTEALGLHSNDPDYFQEKMKNIQNHANDEYNEYFMLCLSSYIYNRELPKDFSPNKMPEMELKQEQAKASKYNKYIMFLEEYEQQFRGDGIPAALFKKYVSRFLEDYNIRDCKVTSFITAFRKDYFESKKSSRLDPRNEVYGNGKQFKLYKCTDEEKWKKWLSCKEDEEPEDTTPDSKEKMMAELEAEQKELEKQKEELQAKLDRIARMMGKDEE